MSDLINELQVQPTQDFYGKLNRKVEAGEWLSSLNQPSKVSYGIGKEYLDSLKGQHNYFADLTAPIPELSDNATDEERQANQELINRKSFAQSVFGAMQYNLGTDKKLQDDLKEFEKLYGTSVNNLSQEQIQLMYSQKAEQNWLNVFDKNGLIKPELLNDYRFFGSITPDTYERLAIARNFAENSWSYTRGYRAYTHIRPLTLALYDGKITYDEYQSKVQMIQSMFKGQDDSKAFYDTGSIVSGMVQPVVDNPLQATAGAVAGTIAGLVTKKPSIAMGVFSSIAWGLDTFQQQQAQSMLAVYEKDPNNVNKYSREEILDKSFWHNLIGASLDTLDDALTVSMLGAGRAIFSPIKAFWKAKGASKVTKEIEEASLKIAREKAKDGKAKIGDLIQIEKAKMGDAAKAVLANASADFTAQVLTEGMQDALAQDAAESIVGTPWGERLQNDFNTAWQTMKDSFSPMGIITLGMHTPKLSAHLLSVHRANAKLDQFLNTQLSLETVADDNNNSTAGLTPDNIDTVLEQRVYIDRTEFDKKLSENGWSIDDFDDTVKQAYKRAENGDKMFVSSSVFAGLDKDKRNVLASITTDKEGALYPEWVRAYLADEEIAKIRQMYQEQEYKKQILRGERRGVEADIYQKLMNSKTISAEEANQISKLYSAFFNAMANITNEPITKLYQTYTPNVERYIGDQTKDSAIEQLGTQAIYDRNSKRIVIKPTADFGSIFHESAHFFLDVLGKERSSSERANAIYKELCQWAQVDYNKVDVDLKENEKLQERFANGFIYYLLSGGKGVTPSLNKFFSSYRSFLSRIKNTSLFSNFDKTKSKADFVRSGYEQAYQDAMPEINSTFENFISSMFTADVMDNILNIDYPYDAVLGEIDSCMALSDDQRAALKEELSPLIQELQDSQSNAMFMMSFNALQDKLANTEEYIKLYESMLKNMTNEQLNSINGAKLKKALNILKTFKENKESILSKLEKNKPTVIKFVDKLSGRGTKLPTGIVVDETITPSQKRRLEKKGFKVYKKDRAGTININNLYQIVLSHFESLQEADKQEILKYVPITDITSDEWALRVLTDTPTVAELAEHMARNSVLQDIIQMQSEEASKSKAKIAKLHNQLAKKFMEQLDSVTYGTKETRAQVKSMLEKIEKIAQLDVYDTVFSDAESSTYFNNARLANKQAKEAIARGELQDSKLSKGAVTFTRNEIYQNEKARFTEEIKMKIAKRVVKYRQLFRREDKALSKQYDVELLSVARAILMRIGVIKNKHFNIAQFNLDDLNLNEKINDLAQRYPQAMPLIENMKELVNRLTQQQFSNTAQANSTLNSSSNLNQYWENMRIGDLAQVLDLLDNIKSLAHSSKVIYKQGKAVLLEDEVIKGLEKLSVFKDRERSTRDDKDPQFAGSKKNRNFWDKTKAVFRDYMSLTDLPETRMQYIDGVIEVYDDKGNVIAKEADPNGVFHDMYQVVRDALTNYMIKKDELGNKAQKIIDSLPKKSIKTDAYASDLVITADDGKPAKWKFGINGFKNKTTFELIGVLLHCGTNFDKLVGGYLNTEHYSKIAQQVFATENPTKQQILDVKKDAFNKFIQKAIDDGQLTEDLFRVVSELHALNKELSTKLQKASIEARGYGFQELEERKQTFYFNGKPKTFTFGYMPAIANSDLIRSPFELDRALDQHMFATYSIAGLKEAGFLQERTSVERPLCLDPVALIHKTDEVLKYIYILPAISQVDKFFNHPLLADMLQRKFPDLYDNVIAPWLMSVATVKSSAPCGTPFLNRVGSVLNYIVRSSAGTLMVGNINNTLQQVSNIPTVLTKVNGKYLLKHLGTTVLAQKELREDISQRSNFMKLRYLSRHNSQETVLNDIIASPKLFEDDVESVKAFARRMGRFIESNTYFAQKWAQDRIDTVVWLAAKEQSVAKGMTEQEGNNFADMVVRTTLGSFDISDTAKISKSNPWAKAFSMFGNYFYTMFRLNQLQLKLASRQYGVANPYRYLHYVYQTMLTAILPAMIAEVIQQSMQTGDLLSDDEDDFNSALASIFWSPIRMTSSAFPVVNKSVGYIIDSIQGKHFYTSAMLSQPWLSSLSSMYNSVSKVFDEDKEFNSRDIKVLLNATAILLGNPAPAMLGRPASYSYAVYTDEVDLSDYGSLTKYLEIVRASITGRPSSDSKVK